jgi:hypothetical protein
MRKIAQRLSSATPAPELSMEAVGYPGLAGAPGSMPLLNSCLVLSRGTAECKAGREVADHEGPCRWLIYGCRVSGSG